MFMRSVVAILAVSGAVSAMPAVAAGSAFYGVASVGRSSIDADATSINTFAASKGVTANTSTSSVDLGWKLQGGYQMTPTWALEGGYTSLGHAKYVTSNAAYTATGYKKTGLVNLDLVGKAELNQSFSLLGRIGGYYWRTDSDMPYATGLNRVRDTGTDIKVGAGIQYDFTRSFAMRGEVERYNGMGSTTTSGDSKVNLFSVGAVLKF